MQLAPEKLADHLSGRLLPVYLLAGDEPLIMIESADAIRQAARDQGYLERQIFHMDQTDWDEVLVEARSMSLFADRRILDIRTDKLGQDGSKALQELCDDLPEETLILISCGKVDKKSLNTKWAKAVSEVGAIIQVWPVKTSQLPYWLSERLRQAGIQANRQAVDILAERVEGNLLAAKQEIDKLLLSLDDHQVDGQAMSAAVADSSRYDLFDLIDRVIGGEVESALRSLRGLREEGDEVLAILWIFARELRTLILIQEGVTQGQSMDTALQNAGVWRNRTKLFRGAVKRLGSNRLALLLRMTRQIDMIAKGQAQGDAWLEMENLVLFFAGKPVRNAATQKLALA